MQLWMLVCTLLTQISRAVHNNTIIKNQGSRQYLVFGVGLKSESRDDESVTWMMKGKPVQLSILPLAG